MMKKMMKKLQTHQNSRLRRLRQQAGFTFIELILYVAILTILMTGLINFLLAEISSNAKSSTQQEVSVAARYLSERLKYEIRNSSGVNFGTSNFGVNIANNSAQQLSLSETVSGNNPTIFNVVSGQLQIKQGAGSVVTLNSTDVSVTNLTFTNNSVSSHSRNISFTLTVTDDLTSARQEYTATETIQSSVEMRAEQ